jgi:hypothetical protein
MEVQLYQYFVWKHFWYVWWEPCSIYMCLYGMSFYKGFEWGSTWRKIVILAFCMWRYFDLNFGFLLFIVYWPFFVFAERIALFDRRASARHRTTVTANVSLLRLTVIPRGKTAYWRSMFGSPAHKAVGLIALLLLRIICFCLYVVTAVRWMNDCVDYVDWIQHSIIVSRTKLREKSGLSLQAVATWLIWY